MGGRLTEPVELSFFGFSSSFATTTVAGFSASGSGALNGFFDFGFRRFFPRFMIALELVL